MTRPLPGQLRMDSGVTYFVTHIDDTLLLNDVKGVILLPFPLSFSWTASLVWCDPVLAEAEEWTE